MTVNPTGDPIVEEVRKARDEIFRRCGYDLAELGKYLRRRRAQRAKKAARLSRSRAVRG